MTEMTETKNESAPQEVNLDSSYVMGPGWVLVRKIHSEEVTSGGIVIPDGVKSEVLEVDGNFVATAHYGEVMKCGIYCDHHGIPYPSMEPFPLQRGDIVEFRPNNPFVPRKGQDENGTYWFIKTVDVFRYWRQPCSSTQS